MRYQLSVPRPAAPWRHPPSLLLPACLPVSSRCLAHLVYLCVDRVLTLKDVATAGLYASSCHLLPKLELYLNTGFDAGGYGDGGAVGDGARRWQILIVTDFYRI